MIKLDHIKNSNVVEIIKESQHYLSFNWEDEGAFFIIRVLFEKEVHLSICQKSDNALSFEIENNRLNRLKQLCFGYTKPMKIVKGKNCLYLQSIPVNEKKSNILFL
ncbi:MULTISPECIES: hypothetical protein [Vagococcus]|uniref:hypothetical protein n=1 Tax=Vagococcus TaxID=2737 RepID=UPI000B34C495|nr:MULTISPECIES: hypothetical protein [Vagococcus]HCM90195.1 hypothetical protein [Vagococcus sp.]